MLSALSGGSSVLIPRGFDFSVAGRFGAFPPPGSAGPPVYGFEPGSPEYLTYLTAYYARLGHPFYGLSNDFASVLSLFVLPLLAWGVVRRKAVYVLLFGCHGQRPRSYPFRGRPRGHLPRLARVSCGPATPHSPLATWLGPGALLDHGTGYLYHEADSSVQAYLADRFLGTTIGLRGHIHGPLCDA